MSVSLAERGGVPRNSPPTSEQWLAVLRTVGEGNNLFPQTFLAAGILAAHRMVELHRQSGIPLRSFLEFSPDPKLVAATVGQDRKLSHAQNGIQTTQRSIKHALLEVGHDNTQIALDFLARLGEVVACADSGGDRIRLGHKKLLDRVQDDPHVHRLLQTAVNVFTFPSVLETSDSFKTSIRTFRDNTQEKYGDHNPADYAPQNYRVERREHKVALRRMVNFVATLIREELIASMDPAHPQQGAIKAELLRHTNDTLFEDMEIVYFSDPIKFRNDE